MFFLLFIILQNPIQFQRMASASTDWKPEEKNRAAIWRLCAKGGTEAMRLSLQHLLDEGGHEWPKWCRDNMKLISGKHHGKHHR